MVNYFLQTRIIYIILFLVIASCAETKHEKQFYGDLGEIPFNEQLDDKHFKVCHEDLTLPFNYAGFGLVYEGEKKKLVKIIRDQYNYPETIGQTGYITIRFIINCEGKTGRFRMTETDTDLKEKKFDKDITHQILTITKELDGWQPLERWEKVWDVQQYLTFKFKDGVITDILP